jgi:hypothetical protein
MQDSLARVRELVQTWGTPDAVEGRLLDAVLNRLERDQAGWSDIFEPSLSWDEKGLHRFRFSFAFPMWRESVDDVSRSMLQFSEPFGPATVEVCERALKAARHGVADQVLFGYARSAGSAPRVKFYIQFAPRHGNVPLLLARKVLGLSVASQSDALPLHMLGLDVGTNGLVGAKLYFLRREMPPQETATWLNGWQQPLRDVLLIHRVGGRSDLRQVTPTDVDFAPRDSGLTWPEIVASPAVRRYEEPVAAIEALGTEFPIRVRYVSFARPPELRFNIYYALDYSRLG